MGGNLYGRATRVDLKDLGGELALTCPKLARFGVKNRDRRACMRVSIAIT
jgi:hypothetical protein